MKYLLTSVAGVKIRWSSDFDEEIDEIADLFRHHICDEDHSSEHYHEIDYRGGLEKFSVPADAKITWKCQFAGALQKRNVTVYESASEGRQYLLITKYMWIIHEPARHHTECHLRLSRTFTGKLERPMIADSVMILMQTIMSLYDRYAYHSGALCIGDHAHIFTGESGHGKTTLCNDLIKQGAAFMGDDISFLFLRDGALWVGSLLFDAKICDPRNKRLKKSVDLIEEYHARAVETAPVKALYYVNRWDRPESSLTLREPMDAMMHMLHSTNNARAQHDVEAWLKVCEVGCSTLPFYQFNFGNRELLDIAMFENA